MPKMSINIGTITTKLNGVNILCASLYDFEKLAIAMDSPLINIEYENIIVNDRRIVM